MPHLPRYLGTVAESIGERLRLREHNAVFSSKL
jgi:hypothetical protein